MMAFKVNKQENLFRLLNYFQNFLLSDLFGIILKKILVVNLKYKPKLNSYFDQNRNALTGIQDKSLILT